jgi:glyoxylase-like metal-dependent hydrolase (beta-lactamase superfamily II)
MKMHLLSGGRLRYCRNIYYPDEPCGGTIELPVSCVLLKHRQGLALFDTGCHPAAATDAAGRWGSWADHTVPIFIEQDTVIGQLPLAGVGVDDVDVVICSHLHYDHCGCNVFFPKATVLAHESEVAAARAPDAAARGVLAAEWDLPGGIEAVAGERDLFGDGRITLLPMPGHTPGMMAAHVVLDGDGAFVLASDAAAVRAHLEQRFTPKNTWNHDLAMKSLQAIGRLQRDGATVLFGHDAEQWAELRRGAACYE